MNGRRGLLDAGWWPILEGLHPTLVEVLRPWLPRLVAALGRPPAVPEAGRGTPDGIDGLASRGSWERLLPSAWALADAWPDEFLRRAAEGELPFLRRAWSPPPGGWTGVVWLDTGPEALGEMRWLGLAGTAALIRQIRAAGGRVVLIWVDGSNVIQTVEATTTLDVAAWREVARASPTMAPEAALVRREVVDGPCRFWAIGGPRHAAVARDVGMAAVAGRPRLDGTGLDVEIDGAEGCRRVRLDAPPAHAGRQLLAELRAPARTAHGGVDGLRIGLIGGRGPLVLARGERAFVVDPERLFADGVDAAREVPGAGPLVAAGVFEVPDEGAARVVALRRRGPVAQFIGLEGVDPWHGAPTSVPVHRGFTTPSPDAPVPALEVLPLRVDGRPRAAALVRDGGDTLWLVDLLGGRMQPVRHGLVGRGQVMFDADIEGWWPWMRLLVARSRRPDAPVRASHLAHVPAEVHSELGPVVLEGGATAVLSDRSERALAELPHGLRRWVRGPARRLYWEDAEGRWFVLQLASLREPPERPRPVSGPVEGTVLSGLGEQALLVLDPDGTAVSRVDLYASERLATLPAPVARGPRGWRIAPIPGTGELWWITPAGRLGHLDLEADTSGCIDLPEGLR